MKARIQAIAVLITFLLLGCLIGAVGSWFRYWKGIQANEKPAKLTFSSSQQEQWLPEQQSLQQRLPEQRLPELLGMTQEQKVMFEEIMRESRRELDAMSREQQLKINAVIAGANEKIRSILNDEQKTRLEMSLKDVNRRRRQGARDGRGNGLSSPSPKGGRGQGRR